MARVSIFLGLLLLVGCGGDPPAPAPTPAPEPAPEPVAQPAPQLPTNPEIEAFEQRLRDATVAVECSNGATAVGLLLTPGYVFPDRDLADGRATVRRKDAVDALAHPDGDGRGLRLQQAPPAGTSALFTDANAVTSNAQVAGIICKARDSRRYRYLEIPAHFLRIDQGTAIIHADLEALLAEHALGSAMFAISADKRVCAALRDTQVLPLPIGDKAHGIVGLNQFHASFVMKGPALPVGIREGLPEMSRGNRYLLSAITGGIRWVDMEKGDGFTVLTGSRTERERQSSARQGTFYPSEIGHAQHVDNKFALYDAKHGCILGAPQEVKRFDAYFPLLKFAAPHQPLAIHTDVAAINWVTEHEDGSATLYRLGKKTAQHRFQGVLWVLRNEAGALLVGVREKADALYRIGSDGEVSVVRERVQLPKIATGVSVKHRACYTADGLISYINGRQLLTLRDYDYTPAAPGQAIVRWRLVGTQRHFIEVIDPVCLQVTHAATRQSTDTSVRFLMLTEGPRQGLMLYSPGTAGFAMYDLPRLGSPL